MTTEREHLIALASYIPFGPIRLKLLLSYFGSTQEVWNVKSKLLLKLGLTNTIVTGFDAHRNNFDSENFFGKLAKLSISTSTIFESTYPSNLKEIVSAPYVLYIKGKLKKVDTNAVAIVGSRMMSSYGKEVTQNFASELSGLGLTIVSGLARGIDTAAHKAALEASGRTIAVLGCGLDKIYPPENLGLSQEIVDSDSAVISEYPPGYPPLKSNFANRNRLISGLAKAVLVVEGRRKSGTLLTVHHALDQGREVFAVPGQIGSPLSEAPLYLLQNGAKMAQSPSDILSELHTALRVDKEAFEKEIPKTQEEESILVTLDLEPLHVDEIARITENSAGAVSGRLTLMEIKGLVKNMGSGVYKRL